MMEAEQRPQKLRKLSHGATGIDSARELQDASTHQRKPEVLPANAAGPEDDSDASSDDVFVQAGEDARAEETPAAADSDPNSSQPPMSKNQLKKLRKKQEWEAGRDYRKTKRKLKTAEKRARKRAAREEASKDGGTQDGLSAHRPRRPTRLPITFIIDCGFDDLMSDKERISLASQLTRAYSDNSRAPYQSHLVITSWGGSLKERFDTVLNKHYENWKGVRCEETDFAIAAHSAAERMNGPRGGKLVAAFEKYAYHEPAQEEPVAGDAEHAASQSSKEAGEAPAKQPASGNASFEPPDPSEKSNGTAYPPKAAQPLPEPDVVYLTSDSPHTLGELKPHSTYIIGGLVDKNRHKGICYRTACDKGIKTAKLPIGEYMQMQSRFVLATNHVVEIMLRWLECGDWGEAFMKVIPKRKGGKLKSDAEPRDGHIPGEDLSADSGGEAEVDYM